MEIIGKIFYGDNRWQGLSRHTAVRETKTTIILDNGTVLTKRGEKHDFLKAKGSSGWDSTTYSIETEILYFKFKRQNLDRYCVRMLEKIKVLNLSVEQVNNLAKLLKEFETALNKQS